ncbi:sporulation peptidase YabG [Paenibacillus ginsengarvi]|uniref:Sporulation peptidase YabG n=1 Tax=Paenibacillus ginsengarvi TaxID=400777 RepID=A0A3B0AYQ4_9BACL|nr:sporulation peptidase YabG [Paenibacillus ginsengarvi]RKN65735.1 sporulation peptidase YabG [Paenibacillus ginsengarvi]
MEQGELVVRRSYGGDVIFKIAALEATRAVLKGVDYRLLADSPITDLQPVQGTRPLQQHYSQMKVNDSLRELARYQMWQREKRQTELGGTEQIPHAYFEVPGKVLHLDGDPTYLRKSMALYGEFHVPAEGYFVTEANMAHALYTLLPQARPDIVVITGHDGILKHIKDRDISDISSYKNSHNFVNAIYAARQYDRNLDSLTVIAGACQSHFEALLRAGANFASSPARVLIHALDPSCIAIKTAFTSVRETVNVADVIRNTISGYEGVGGVETRGSYRLGLPRLKAPQPAT